MRKQVSILIFIIVLFSPIAIEAGPAMDFNKAILWGTALHPTVRHSEWYFILLSGGIAGEKQFGPFNSKSDCEKNRTLIEEHGIIKNKVSDCWEVNK